MRNKYCESDTLRNEADVEQNFIRRLLEDFGYSDAEIRPKVSLAELTVGGMRGMPQQRYRPDFGLKVSRKVRWIVEAKAPNEDLDQHEWQPRGYCVLMNGADHDLRPVKYYLLTNGGQTRLYNPDRNAPLITLNFQDFADTNDAFRRLRDLLSRDRILAEPERIPANVITLEKPPLGEVNAAFAWCHQHIYKKDNISQSDAFSEFVKLISLKLISDRRIRDAHPEIMTEPEIELPIEEVPFSVNWIDHNEQNSRNPINDIQFRRFMEEMEREIALGVRKRIFEVNDQIRLRPETIRGVVRRLEKIFLFGIDADLNGRLFETFLNATMRGKDLGQFFTPRSLVKLGVRLSRFQVGVADNHGRRHTDTVIDACCGTGGFLIDALADMWAKVDAKQNLSQTEKTALKLEIANRHIVGVDVANAPKLARIARLNMYLHGDGGTRIFHLNSLDKEVRDLDSDSIDTTAEKRELRQLIATAQLDVALTNPPFAKAVDRETEDEARVLDQYQIGRDDGVPRASIRSALLFIERYHDLLRPGGRLVTVIDDGILSGETYKWFRDKLREWFIIRAVVSLPGDAFQRANARVKTSYLIAEKRDAATQQDQGPVFMYPCQFVGIDDQKRQRARAGDAAARLLADGEIQAVMAEYDRFTNGEPSQYSVAATQITDRLDVKNCLMHPGRSVESWRERGFRILPLSAVLAKRTYGDDEVITKDDDELVRLVVVRYNGDVDAGEEISPADGSYAKMYPVHTGDIIISNIAAHYGSIAVIPAHLDGCVVSNEYTVLTARPGFDPVVLQLVLRSPEIRADILLSASGANRTRANWEAMQTLQIPYPDDETAMRVRALADDADEARSRADIAKRDAVNQIEANLLLRSTDADTILAAFKPPK
jgi:type I restriction enzyme M protein